jgi:hypothetical protein
LTSIQVKGPLNDGTVAVKNQSDLTRSRVQLKYLIVEADPSVAALTLDQALTSALTAAALDPTVTKYGNIVRQDATSRRLGPKKVEVTVTFGRSPAPPNPSSSAGIASFQARSAQVRVYRLPYIVSSDAAAIDPTSGLPSGDFADFRKLSANGLPQSEINLSGYPFDVPEIGVSLPARLSQASFNDLMYDASLGTGNEYSGTTFGQVGKYNQSEFTWGGIKFAEKTLRFDTADAQWVSENGVFVYYINYQFTWRPRGFYQQTLIAGTATNGPGGSDARGYQVTTDVEFARDTVDFADKFPLS